MPFPPNLQFFNQALSQTANLTQQQQFQLQQQIQQSLMNPQLGQLLANSLLSQQQVQQPQQPTSHVSTGPSPASWQNGNGQQQSVSSSAASNTQPQEQQKPKAAAVSSFLVTGPRFSRIPCRARSMPVEHNYEVILCGQTPCLSRLLCHLTCTSFCPFQVCLFYHHKRCQAWRWPRLLLSGVSRQRDQVFVLCLLQGFLCKAQLSYQTQS